MLPLEHCITTSSASEENNYWKTTKTKVQKFHNRIINVRRDFLHKTMH